MDTLKTITPTIAIAGQPTADDLKALKAQGYVGVVNLRNEGEPDQPIGPAAEAGVAKAAGLEYLHYAVGGTPLDPAGVNSVIDFLDRHKADKVLVHCRSGGRAAALVLLYEAKIKNWPASEAITNGRVMGLEVKGGLQAIVEQYLATS
jgi:uncharacterized protein (TIGR01244 family)